MTLRKKPVYLDGRALGVEAATTYEAAVASGARFDVDSPFQRSQHISEGPDGFYVTSRRNDHVVPRLP